MEFPPSFLPMRRDGVEDEKDPQCREGGLDIGQFTNVWLSTNSREVKSMTLHQLRDDKNRSCSLKIFQCCPPSLLGIEKYCMAFVLVQQCTHLA